MNEYFIRTIVADWPVMLDLAQRLGVIDGDGNMAARTLVWVPFGAVMRPTGQMLTDPETGAQYPEELPVLAPDGQPYQHANLITADDLRERAEASGDPEILAALAEISRFFVVDENGAPKRPENPAVVMAGD